EGTRDGRRTGDHSETGEGQTGRQGTRRDGKRVGALAADTGQGLAIGIALSASGQTTRKDSDRRTGDDDHVGPVTGGTNAFNGEIHGSNGEGEGARPGRRPRERRRARGTRRRQSQTGRQRSGTDGKLVGRAHAASSRNRLVVGNAHRSVGKSRG